jgi:folate-binding protein YgfZ
MRNASEVVWLDDLGLVRIRGSDAVRFLQGQLSNDVTRLNAGNSLLAGYHNPQGRAIALLRLVHWDEGDMLAVVPRELAAGVVARLSKYVLRAKVKITDESRNWRIGGLIGPTKVEAGTGTASEAGSKLDLPQQINAQLRVGDAVFVWIGDQRALVLSPADNPPPLGDCRVGDLETWQRLEVAAGQPQVYGATSEEFVAQMLNLDMLNAIAFDKGCYTGQEVIARAHYRGKVKRRMQRFISREPCRLAAGDSGQLTDGRSFKVVLAAGLKDGRCDFLAVAALPNATAEDGGTAISNTAAAIAETAGAVTPATAAVTTAISGIAPAAAADAVIGMPTPAPSAALTSNVPAPPPSTSLTSNVPTPPPSTSLTSNVPTPPPSTSLTSNVPTPPTSPSLTSMVAADPAPLPYALPN